MLKKTINIVTLSMGAGGAEKVISLLLPKLINDYNVNLILFNDIRHFFIPKEVNTYIIVEKNPESKKHKIFSFLATMNRYKSIVGSTKPDVSISFLPRPNIMNALFRFKDSKIILSERCYPSIAYKSNKYRYWLYKILIPVFYNRSDVVFSNSEHINNDLRLNFNVNTPLKVIYNPIELVDSEIISDFDDRDFDIIWVGKIVQIKNPLLLIKALALCEPNYKSVVLGAAIDTPLMEEARVLSQNIDIAFKGNVDNVNHYLNLSKILVLTSNSEGFPNVVLEAMSYGLPIISTNCLSGPLELLNENEEVFISEGEYLIVKYGILINVNDAIALSKAILMVLNNSDLYKALSEKSFERSKMYSTSNIYKKLIKIIDSERKDL